MRIKRLLPLLLLALAASCLGNLCSPTPGPPPEDSCSPPSSDGVVTLEAGPDGDPFVPFTDEQVVSSVTGGQGLAMLPIRLRVGGATPPACLAQHTTLTDAMGNEMARDKDPRATYADGGFRTTHALYLVLFDGFAEPAHPFTLTVTVGGKAITRTIYFGEKPTGSDGDSAAPSDTADAQPTREGTAPIDAEADRGARD